MDTLWHQQLFHTRDWIPQGTAKTWSYQLLNDSGAPLTLTQVTTVSLTIYDLDATPPVPIPGTWPRDVKNLNGGAVSQTGLLTLSLSALDNALISELHARELRRWSLDWTHASGTKPQHFQVDRIIANIL